MLDQLCGGQVLPVHLKIHLSEDGFALHAGWKENILDNHLLAVPTDGDIHFLVALRSDFIVQLIKRVNRHLPDFEDFVPHHQS